MTQELIARVFDVDAMIITDPAYGRPLCIPLNTRERVIGA